MTVWIELRLQPIVIIGIHEIINMIFKNIKSPIFDIALKNGLSGFIILLIINTP